MPAPPTATRVVLAPPERWDESKLMDAARSLAAPATPLRPGDAVGALVVARVEPENGLAADARTVFEVRAAPFARAGPAHVAVLIDVGESMSLPWDSARTRLDAARDGLLSHLGSLPDGAQVSLFTFAKDAKLVTGPFAASALTKGSIDLPAPKGSARLAGAIDTALAHLVARPSATVRPEILILSDGAGDPAALRKAVARAKRLSVKVHAWVFAPDVDALFVESAHDTGGHVEKAAIPLTFGDAAP